MDQPSGIALPLCGWAILTLKRFSSKPSKWIRSHNFVISHSIIILIIFYRSSIWRLVQKWLHRGRSTGSDSVRRMREFYPSWCRPASPCMKQYPPSSCSSCSVHFVAPRDCSYSRQLQEERAGEPVLRPLNTRRRKKKTRTREKVSMKQRNSVYRVSFPCAIFSNYCFRTIRS